MMTPEQIAAVSPVLDALLEQGRRGVEKLLDALLAPTVIDGEETVDRVSAAAEKDLQDLVVKGIDVPGLVMAGLMSKANWLAYADNSTLEAQVSARLDKRFAYAVTRELKVDAMLYEREIRAAEAKVVKRGGEAYAKASTTQTRRQPTRTQGPSWWDTNFPNQPPPSLHDIRQILNNKEPKP